MPQETAPDMFLSFDINPGTLLQFLNARSESGPRLKCFDGGITLVSAGMSHGITEGRIDLLLLAVAMELKTKFSGLGSTTWSLPDGAGDTAYEADSSFYIQSFGRATPDQMPDLAIEIVVSHCAMRAIWAGEFLKIPELWVLDLTQHRVTFYQLTLRGKRKGKYRPTPRSRAFPILKSSDVLERLEDPETDDIAFLETSRAWARQVLVPRFGAGAGEAH